MRVMKFGGAALRDGPAIERSMRLVERAAQVPGLLLVVSAQEGVTAQLAHAVDEAARGDLEPWNLLRVRHRSVLTQLGLEGDLLDRHLFELRAILEELRSRASADRRMRDYVLSFGERMSARVVSAVLRKLGCPSTPLDAYDLGMTTASRQGEGALLRAPTADLRAALRAVPGVPVVTGFLALDPGGNLTTLGPNGSDLSAVWFGEAVGASEVVLWKTVAGFMTADPDVVPEARRIPRLGRHEAVEFAVNGAEVLHAGALEPAERAGIVVRVANVNEPDAPGSLIEAESPRAGALGLAHRSELALYRETLSLGRDQGAQLAELFAALAEEALDPCQGTFSGREAAVFVQDHARVERFAARRARARVERGLASFAVVGREVSRDVELVRRVAALGASAGVAVEPAPGGSHVSSAVFLVPAARLSPVLRAVHAGLFGGVPELGDELLPHPRTGAVETR